MLAKLFARDKAAEAPVERRREGRRPVQDGDVEIGGVRYPLQDWSYSGFLARDYDGEHETGQRIEVAVSVRDGAEPIEFACKAILVRVDHAGGKLVGAFVELDTALRVELARHFG